jgi:hypothetical protein
MAAEAAQGKAVSFALLDFSTWPKTAFRLMRSTPLSWVTER